MRHARIVTILVPGHPCPRACVHSALARDPGYVVTAGEDGERVHRRAEGVRASASSPPRCEVLSRTHTSSVRGPAFRVNLESRGGNTHGSLFPPRVPLWFPAGSPKIPCGFGWIPDFKHFCQGPGSSQGGAVDPRAGGPWPCIHTGVLLKNPSVIRPKIILHYQKLNPHRQDLFFAVASARLTPPLSGTYRSDAESVWAE